MTGYRIGVGIGVTPDRWSLDGEGILWEPAANVRLPHEDHLEMSGRRVSVIVRCVLDSMRNLHLDRRVF